MSDLASHSGGCRCGAVRFAAATEPAFLVYCHCDDCRRATGAPVVAFVGFEADAVTWPAAAQKVYRNGKAERVFCAECGTPLGYRHDSRPDRAYFYTTIMDHPENYPPRAHVFASRQLAWLHLADDLPRHPATLEIRID